MSKQKKKNSTKKIPKRNGAMPPYKIVDKSKVKIMKGYRM